MKKAIIISMSGHAFSLGDIVQIRPALLRGFYVGINKDGFSQYLTPENFKYILRMNLNTIVI